MWSRFNVLIRTTDIMFWISPSKCRNVVSSIVSSTIRYNFSTKLNVSTPRLQTHAFPQYDITFLGTGGSNASRFRGVSSTMLCLGAEKWIFDVGEGTVRQAVFTNSIMETNRIFITHLHPDHILGLTTLILCLQSKEFNESPQPLSIYGPQGLHQFLSVNLRLTESKLRRTIIVHEFIVTEDDYKKAFLPYRSPWPNPVDSYAHPPGVSSGPDLNDTGKFSLELQYIKSDSAGLWKCYEDERGSVNAGLIVHRIPCFGFVCKERPLSGALSTEACSRLGVKDFQHFKALKNGLSVTLEDNRVILPEDVLGPMKRGRKFVYLGDTSNATNLKEAARDCDLLVHECTYPDEMKPVANKRGHSTPTMLAKTALMFQTKRVIMNHIGSRFVQFEMRDDGKITTSDEIRSEQELFHQAVGTFKRKNHLRIAKDFMTASIPIGGFDLHNDIFPIKYEKVRFGDV